MNILHIIRNARTRRQSARFAAAQIATPLHDDNPAAGCEAEYWLDVCHERCATPLIHDAGSREILERAARWHATTGYCARLYRFNDNSKLVISQMMEAVL